MATQEEEGDAALQLDVAIALLPLIGRCAEVSGGKVKQSLGNRLETSADRRTLVCEVARCWCALDGEDRRRYGKDRQAALAEFAADYVDEVEALGPDQGDERTFGYEIAVDIMWRRHAEMIRLREASTR